MAARWLQAKNIKIRKAYLKHKRSMPLAYWTEEYQRRANGIAFNEPVQTHVHTRFNKGKLTHRPGVEENELLIKQWEVDKRSSLLQKHKYIVLSKRKGFSFYMFFDGNQYQFIKVNPYLLLVSRIYADRNQAMRLYEYDRITWEQEFSEAPD